MSLSGTSMLTGHATALPNAVNASSVSAARPTCAERSVLPRVVVSCPTAPRASRPRARTFSTSWVLRPSRSTPLLPISPSFPSTRMLPWTALACWAAVSPPVTVLPSSPPARVVLRRALTWLSSVPVASVYRSSRVPSSRVQARSSSSMLTTARRSGRRSSVLPTSSTL